jgi:hypothetical protein
MTAIAVRVSMRGDLKMFAEKLRIPVAGRLAWRELVPTAFRAHARSAIDMLNCPRILYPDLRDSNQTSQGRRCGRSPVDCGR